MYNNKRFCWGNNSTLYESDFEKLCKMMKFAAVISGGFFVVFFRWGWGWWWHRWGRRGTVQHLFAHSNTKHQCDWCLFDKTWKSDASHQRCRAFSIASDTSVGKLESKIKWLICCQSVQMGYFGDNTIIICLYAINSQSGSGIIFFCGPLAAFNSLC